MADYEGTKAKRVRRTTERRTSSSSSSSSSTHADYLFGRCASLSDEIESRWIPAVDSQGGLNSEEIEEVRRLIR